jgi:hypothetical protein
MPGKLVFEFSLQVPNSKVASGGGGQAATARAPGNMLYPIGSAIQLFRGFVTVHVPETGEPILSARSQVMAIW